MMRKETQDRKLFDKIAAKYALKDTVKSSSLAREAQLFNALKEVLKKDQPIGVIVEIGCGAGATARYLKGKYKRYIGIDQSPKMIESAKFLNTDITNAEFMVKNLKDKDILENTADLILSIGALHHMTELDRVMGSIIKISKPGASFVAVEPQKTNRLIQVMRKIRGAFDASYSKDQSYFSGKDLSDLLQKHGISVMSIDYQGFLTPPFAQVIINPQVLSVPLSRLAVKIDNWLSGHLSPRLKRLSFNIVVEGRIRK